MFICANFSFLCNMLEQIIQLEIRRSSGRMSLNGIKKLNLLRASKVVDIGTPQKKDYFLCSETPGAAKAWISTLL